MSVRDDQSWTEILPAGMIVSGHRIIEVASQGGFATVYRARHLSTGQEVAIKVLAQDLTASERLRRRFRQEAQALLQLRHPHIVGVREYGELLDGRPYFVMDWIPGEDLRQVIAARGAFSPREALGLVEQVGSALAAAHAAGIVHRDLKAQNVMAVPRDGWFHLELVDFGVAKLLAPELLGIEKVLTASTIVGTPYYMAPEQILGQPVDQRTDIYALGLLLYEMLTAELPFRGETRVEVEEKHLRAPPPRVSDAAAIAVDLDPVIERCLAKDPRDRYPAVTELVDDLRARVLAAGERAAVRPPARRGLALLVEARLDPSVDDIPDDAFADSERLLDTARATLAAAGLGIEVETPASLLAVAPLPRETTADARERARVLAVGVALGRTLAARDEASPLITVAISAHAAPVGPGGDAGALLCLGEWAPGDVVPGVWATEIALDGLDLDADEPDARGLRRLR